MREEKCDDGWQIKGLAVWWNGQYLNPVPWYPGIVPDDNWSIKGIEDFDRDNKSDVLWSLLARPVRRHTVNLRSGLERRQRIRSRRIRPLLATTCAFKRPASQVCKPGLSTVAAVYDRRFFPATCHKTGGHRPPLQWEWPSG